MTKINKFFYTMIIFLFPFHVVFESIPFQLCKFDVNCPWQKCSPSNVPVCIFGLCYCVNSTNPPFGVEACSTDWPSTFSDHQVRSDTNADYFLRGH
ncbi:unnamed protein product [Trifolium pratense]|uniref:Uncharacterized protein n=1 Tax=Trifolium pratense TaxID=57577 RepID=A0ACB0KKF1_TRIPR|nr:unnamed protein product [Trifolium pratense]